MQRRSFFGTFFSGLVGAASAKPAKPKAGDVPMRELGRTGQKLTCIGMGGGRFHLIPLEEATAMIRRAYDLGINYFDMARGYYKGHAEEIYGSVIPEFRKDIFLTSKSGQRTREGAEADLENSLKTMRTDHLDLWQMHSVGTKADIEKILGPGGALEAFVAAKKAGKVRFFGFTGHADPDINLQLLRSYDGFDTMLMPLHVSDTVFLSFSENVVPVAQEHGIGILGMKVFGSAYLLRTFSVEDCLSYTLNLPVTAMPLGFTTPGQLDDDVRIARKFKPLSPEAVQALRARAHADFDVMGGPVAHGPSMEFWKKKS